jgi:tetratricopeptide (TPR) repeat protein
MSQDTSVKILRKINEAKKELKRKNIQGCLLQFRTALEIAIAEKVMPSDKKTVQAEIEGLLTDIQNNPQFKQIFGPVTFSGSEFDVALAFVKELIQASAEELFESTDLSKSLKSDHGEKQIGTVHDKEVIFSEAMTEINNDRIAEAKALIAEDEEILDRVIDALNDSGISARRSGKYNDALLAYSRGIELRPNEEGLHYNMARAYFEKGDLPSAFVCLHGALKINPDFVSAREFLDYLKSKRDFKSGNNQ